MIFEEKLKEEAKLLMEDGDEFCEVEDDEDGGDAEEKDPDDDIDDDDIDDDDIDDDDDDLSEEEE